MAKSTDDSETENPLFSVKAPADIQGQNKYLRILDIWFLAPLRIILNDWRGIIGLGLLFLYIFMGTFGMMLIEPPVSHVDQRMLPPFQTWEFPLGTETSGKSLLGLLVHGTPPILKMVLSGAVVATVVGTVVGLVSGYKSGIVDTVLMVITDIFLTLPGLPLIIVISFVFQPENPYTIGLILAINRWTGLARSVRSQVLTLRESAYVEASRVMKIPLHTILIEDILPNLMPYVLVNFMNAARGVIFASVGLYFLGILPSSTPNWGIVINNAYNQGGLYSLDAAHWIVFPVLTIGLFSLSLILLSQAADKIFNPRVRARHAETTSGGEELGP